MRFKKSQLVTMGALIGIGLFNPASVAILETYFQWFYTGLFVISSAWVVFFLLRAVLKPEAVKVPPKTTKNKRDNMSYEVTA